MCTFKKKYFLIRRDNIRVFGPLAGLGRSKVFGFDEFKNSWSTRWTAISLCCNFNNLILLYRNSFNDFILQTYNDNAGSRAMTISFSNDSTCTSMQMTNSATFPIATHTETLTLYPVPQSNWPHTIFCSYPDWMPGHWEHMVIDQSTIVYKDHSSFKTYTMKCIENEVDSEKFLVFSRSQW